ncbi:MAG: InlB B-repeat-containing protein [Clostridiales bacterium]|nr:InlB B-repeat-containing protein [Clostridiales bacterium]
MKRAKKLLMLLVVLFAFTSCENDAEADNSINVMFFTANQNATMVSSYLNLEQGEKIEEPEAPKRQGFTFTGWYKDFYKTEPWDFDKDTLDNESIVLYADWQPTIFAIEYVLNGGEMPNDDFVKTFNGGEFGVLPLPAQEGFSFVSWYTYEWKDKDGKVATIPGDKGYLKIPDVVEDVTLYAHWKPIVVDVKFNVNYPEDDGPVLDVTRTDVNYGDTIDFEVLEDTDKYTFEGWNIKRDGTGDFYVNGELFERKLRLTLYASWKEK